MPKVKIVQVETESGPRSRLRITLLDGSHVNVRVHGCSTCNFLEWSKPDGIVVSETVVSDEFIEAISQAVSNDANRCLPELVPEGLLALA